MKCWRCRRLESSENPPGRKPCPDGGRGKEHKKGQQFSMKRHPGNGSFNSDSKKATSVRGADHHPDIKKLGRGEEPVT